MENSALLVLAEIVNYKGYSFRIYSLALNEFY
jgi:hypothetical protein